jgi:hypothetical protein
VLEEFIFGDFALADQNETRNPFEWLFRGTQKNAGAVYSLKFHLVWCPKYRRPVLVKAVEKRLRELLAEEAEELQAAIVALEVIADHVHLFIETDPRWSISQLTRQFKGYTRLATSCATSSLVSGAGCLRFGRDRTLQDRAEQ